MNQEQRKAYEWAKNQDYPSVAARYAKILAGLVDEMAKPNEPLTLDKKRVIAESCLHYSKSGCCTLQGYAPLDCPRCKEWHSNESNEALTLEQLREMDGEPVYIVFSPDVDGEKLQFWALVAVDEWDDVYLANKDEWAFNYEEFLEDVEAIYRSHISRCCNGKAKTAGGLSWRYA